MPVTATAVSSGIQAGASVLDTTISGLFQSGVTNAQKNLINAQKDKINQDTRLDLLSNDQKQQLAEQMAQAQTDADREKLIEDAISASQVASINAIATIEAAKAQSGSQTTLFIIGGFTIIAIIGVVFLLKQKD